MTTYVGWAAVAAFLVSVPSAAWAQNQPAEPVHDMSKMNMEGGESSARAWHLMQDGALYVLFNHQGGPRGGDEVKAPNWWMGMASRQVGAGTLTLSSMLSLDPATVGARGYRELFQVGEAFDGAPVIDRQHPHDAWMQLSASWRAPLGARSGVTVAGGLSGEPALGPVAFMHRASAAAIPLAPLGHHTFDSTHVAFGVATVGADHGRLAVEASVFNGREPDQHRWDLDFGRMDSFSGRLSYRPTATLTLQVSSGHLVEPEALHHGNVTRTTGSVSYLRGTEPRMMAFSAGFGMNATTEVTRHAAFLEGTSIRGGTTLSGRAELVEVESMLLATGLVPEDHHDEARKNPVGALTVGIQREVGAWARVSASVGANGSVFYVPDILRATHGGHPVSFQVFLQFRPRAGAMGRMWNMQMAAPPIGRR